MRQEGAFKRERALAYSLAQKVPRKLGIFWICWNGFGNGWFLGIPLEWLFTFQPMNDDFISDVRFVNFCTNITSDWGFQENSHSTPAIIPNTALVFKFFAYWLKNSSFFSSSGNQSRIQIRKQLPRFPLSKANSLTRTVGVGVGWNGGWQQSRGKTDWWKKPKLNPQRKLHHLKTA